MSLPVTSLTTVDVDMLPDIVTVDLNKQVKPEKLDGVLSLLDRECDMFCTRFSRGGTPVKLSGCTVKAWYTGEDGVPVTITGAYTDDMAVVRLPKECYAVPGRFTLTIKVDDGTVTRTVRLIQGFMYASVGAGLWKDIVSLSAKQTAANQITFTIVPGYDTGKYALYEVKNGAETLVTIFESGLHVITATGGEHTYYVVPMLGSVEGNKSDTITVVVD